MKQVRTRFAPSPSGFLHVGGARTALFNYLYARATGGKFIIRIEDTDQDRSTPESERIILDSLKWLGIYADEGVDEGGPHAPYRQSQRLDTYKEFTDKLIKEKKAYYCFCSDHELEAKQNQSKVMGLPHVYDGKCLALSDVEVQEKIKAGEKYTIRFHIQQAEIVVNDLVQGKVKFDSKLIGDFIIVKSDGFPSYNYAVVIDDHLMEITHVIRGVGHLSNTPRQILIHEALGIDLPIYAHISEIVGTDKKKLSKRRGATSVLYFKELGYISQAFVNYMALLGWYPEDAAEFMPDNLLEKKFDIHRCSKSPSMFDFFLTEKAGEGEIDTGSMTLSEVKKFINKKTKLNFLNNKYIRYMDATQVFELAVPFIEKDPSLATLLKQDRAKMQSVFETLRIYLDTLEEIVPYMKELFKSKVELESKEAEEILKVPVASSVLLKFKELLSQKRPSSPEEFSAVMKETGTQTGAKGKDLFMTIRVAATGSMHGLELPTLFTILGVDAIVDRLMQMNSKII